MAKHSFHSLFLIRTIAVIAVLSLATSAHAEPVPGDSCSPLAAGTATLSAGPEDGGEGYELVCDGSEWKSVLEFIESTGRARLNIGNDQGTCDAEKTGRIRYDEGDDLWEYCDGSDPWKRLIPLAPIAHYKFDSATGTTATDEIAGNNGTLINMTNADWVAGADGNALDFDGSNDTVDLNVDNYFDLTGAMSLAFWINAPPRAVTKHIVSKNAGDGGNVPWQIALVSDGKLRYFGVGAGSSIINSTDSITDNTWHHIAMVRTASDVTFYIDGVQDSGGWQAYSPPGTNSATPNIGSMGSGSGSNFIGQIDDVRIYNQALTAGDILTLYNSY